MKRLFILPFVLASIHSSASGEEQELNVARPDRDSYVDPIGHREAHEYSDAEVNEARVYDFYQRQADHYMTSGARPKLVPAFPGLDAGLHGHWGLHSQNKHNDGRWNDMDLGSTVGQTIRHGKVAAGKGIAIRVDDGLAACFDPETLGYPLMWSGGFVKYDPYRWGTSRNASPGGEVWLKREEKGLAWTRGGEQLKTEYHGYYRHGARAIFSFEVDGQEVLSSPVSVEQGGESVFAIAMTFPDGFRGGELSLGELSKDWKAAVAGADIKQAKREASLVVPELGAKSSVAVAFEEDRKLARTAAEDAAKINLSDLISGGPLQWPDAVITKGTLSNDEKAPYVIDTITIPGQSGFNSVMQITSVGFLPDGTALVATLAGEMWSVSGLDDKLEKVTWKRFASGLHQPIGIHIDEDGVFVLERGQITRLHDLNYDGEADHYETWANDFDGRNKSHTHSFGLERDEDGAFYFVNWKDILRTGPDRTTQHYAFGVRNCMGFGKGENGEILAGPQEGTQTPASMVIDVHEGEFYGHPGDNPGSTISPPLCFVPRGIDNSTGGFVKADKDRWGPLGNHTIGLSYGYATHYLVLRDNSTSRHQGAVVPLEGDFLSGIMRGAVSPVDGQLYVTGIDGWGDYSVADGCFQRIRYTGAKLYNPIGFRVHANGLLVDLSTELDESKSTDPANFFVQQWDYQYSNQYGSPEFSHRQPESLGHDVLGVRSVVLIDSDTLFIEIPDIEPVMQMHLRMHLAAADGTSFKTDIFPTIVELGEHFESPGLAAPVEGKPTSLAMRVNFPTGPAKLVTESGIVVEGAREIILKCSAALQFDRKLIEARAGEDLKLTFENPDIMPHNVVFVTEGNLKKVGDLSFSMLNDPKAAEKHYTPDVEEVIAGTYLVQPGGKHTLYFTAPKEPGDHHFVCTFPGHWMTMNGMFRVTAK